MARFGRNCSEAASAGEERRALAAARRRGRSPGAQIDRHEGDMRLPVWWLAKRLAAGAMDAALRVEAEPTCGAMTTSRRAGRLG